ncbi:MAG: phosphatase PAP2 family protein [Candidatus Aenigmatarchaeota archaeon]
MLAGLLAMDVVLFRLFNTFISNRYFDVLVPVVSHLGSVWVWIPLSVVILSYRRLLGRRLITGLVAVNAVVIFLKDVFDRVRPCDILPNARALDTEPFSSFPSGHAANAFLAAAILSVSYPRYKWHFYALAAVVALSRVYLGVHYPSDVAAGALLGIVVGWSVVKYITRENAEIKVKKTRAKH